jgi:hypothetical protein
MSLELQTSVDGQHGRQKTACGGQAAQTPPMKNLKNLVNWVINTIGLYTWERCWIFVSCNCLLGFLLVSWRCIFIVVWAPGVASTATAFGLAFWFLVTFLVTGRYLDQVGQVPNAG